MVRIIKNILLLLFIGMFSGCESWLDVNQDPDSPKDVGYEELLPAGISGIAYVIGGKYQVLGSLWSQHWTQSPGASQYNGLDSYDINSSTYDANQFGELYAGALQNLERVRMESIADEEYNYYLIATVMQCYIFQVLVDLYNQIPFSEALMGDQGNTEPIYESGEAIYDSLIARLDFALSLDYDKDELKDPETRDLVFNGTMKHWIAFANTLKLKILIRQSNVNPTKAETGIRALYTSEADFLTTDALLNIYTNESGRRNPLYDTEEFALGGNPNLILSNTLYSFLLENGDFTRLDYMFNKPSLGGGHKALIQGNFYAPEEVPGINSASYSKPVLKPESPVYLLSLSESNLLQAEAIIRYNTDDFIKAKELYDAAILNSYFRVLYPDYSELISDIQLLANDFTGGVYAFPSEGSELEVFMESISTQKWLSLSGIQNLELFFETNRTGYPNKSLVPGDHPDYKAGELTVSVNNVTSGRFPQRLIFPESEYSNNKNTPPLKQVWEPVWWNIND